MSRLTAVLIEVEGDEPVERPVPLRTFLAFRDAHGFTVDECVRVVDRGEVVQEGKPWEDWIPWVVHNTFRRPEPFDAFVEQVDWVNLKQVDEDPSGGVDTQTRESSPE